VAFGIHHLGHGPEQELVEPMRPFQIKALHDPRPARGGPLGILLRQRIKAASESSDVLAQFLGSGLNLGPGHALARQRPHEAVRGPHEHCHQRLVVPQQRAHILNQQRLGVGQRGVLGK
jgi:hypothetical protein